MKIKKSLSLILIMSFMITCISSINVNAQTGDNSIENERYEIIQELYDQRDFLLFDYENNLDEIANIDSQLESLGVTFITDKEMASTYHFFNELTRVDIWPSTDDFLWSEYTISYNSGGSVL